MPPDCHTLDALVALYQSRDRIAQCLEVERALRRRSAAPSDVPYLGLAVVVVEDSMQPRLHVLHPRTEPTAEQHTQHGLLLTTSGESLLLPSLSDKRSLEEFTDNVLGLMVAEFMAAGHRMGYDPTPVKTEASDSVAPGSAQQPEWEPLFSMLLVVDGVQRRHRAHRCLEQARRCNAVSEAAGGPPRDGTDQTYSELLRRWESLEEVIEARKGHLIQAELRPFDPQFDASLVQQLLAFGSDGGGTGALQPIKHEGSGQGALWPIMHEGFKKEEQSADAEAFISCDGQQPGPHPDLDPDTDPAAEASRGREDQQPRPHLDPDLDPDPAAEAVGSCEGQQPGPRLDPDLDLDPATAAVRSRKGQQPIPQADAGSSRRPVAPGLRERRDAPPPRLASNLRLQREHPPAVSGSAANSQLGAGARAAVPPAELRGPNPSRHKPAPSQLRESAPPKKPPSTFQDERSQAYIAKKRAYREEMDASSALLLPAVRVAPVPSAGRAASVLPAGRARSAPLLDRPEPLLLDRRAHSSLLPAATATLLSAAVMQQRSRYHPAVRTEHGGGSGAHVTFGGSAEVAPDDPSEDRRLMMMTEGEAEAWAGIQLPTSLQGPPPEAAPRKRAKTSESQPDLAVPPRSRDANGRLPPPGALRKGRGEEAPPGALQKDRDKEPWLLPPPGALPKRRVAAPWLLQPPGAPQKDSSKEPLPLDPPGALPKHRVAAPWLVRPPGAPQKDSGDEARPLHTSARSPVQPPRDPRVRETRCEEAQRERHTLDRTSPPRGETRRQHASSDPREERGAQREEPREHGLSRQGSSPRELRQQRTSGRPIPLTEWRLTDKLHGVLEELPPEAAMVVYDTALGMVLRQQCRVLHRESFSMDEVRQMIPMTTVSEGQGGRSSDLDSA